MKKILFILFLFLNVMYLKAYTFSEWSSEYPTGVNEILIESEVRYKWYKETESNIEYLPKSELEGKLYNLDDYTYTQFTEPSMRVPNYNSEIDVKSSYQKILLTENDVDHIFLSNFISAQPLYFSEVDVFDTRTNTKIDYVLDPVYNSEYNSDEINNDNLEDGPRLYLPKRIALNLGTYYNAYNLEIVIHYRTEGDNQKSFLLGFSYFVNHSIFTKNINLNNCPTGCEISLKLDGSYSSLFLQTIGSYQYRTKIYKTYTLEKEYTDEYYSELDGYIKDESTQTTFYRYITDEYIMTDAEGNVVKDDTYCYKNLCIIQYVKKKKTKRVFQLIYQILKLVMKSTKEYMLL